MLSLFSIRNLSLLPPTRCAQFNSSWNGDSDHYVDPYAQSDFDELLAFGANMTQIPSSSHIKVSNTLLKLQKDYPGTGIQLHRMVGRLLSDACGEIPGILEGIGSIPPANLSDERMQKLVASDTETLKRLHEVSNKLGPLERKHKTVQSFLESKTATGSKKKEWESNKDETRLLREKLEAIRSMEKYLDESESGNGN
jgi:hypothetical protein